MRRQGGFGLLEVMVSLFIAGIVIFGLLNLAGRAFIDSQSAEQKAQASLLLDSQIGMLGLMNDAQKQQFWRTILQVYQASHQQEQPIQAYAKTARLLTHACEQQVCNDEQFAIAYAVQSVQNAANHGLMLSVIPCDLSKQQNAAQSICLAAAWGAQAVEQIEQGCGTLADLQTSCLSVAIP